MNRERLKRAPNIAIVGSSSPLGKELKEMLDGAGFPVGKLSLIETEEYAGLLQEFAGEIRITQILSPETFADIDIALFACSPEIINAYAAAGSAFPELTIDLTQTQRKGIVFLGGVSPDSLLNDGGCFLNPHPASIVLGRVLSRIWRSFAIDYASVTVLEPASERGGTGVDELQEQTVNLLNFQPVESSVFGGQLAFNLLPEIERESRVEDLIRSHIAAVLGNEAPPVAIAAVQAPVFHSHAFSVFLRLPQAPSAEKLAGCLRHGGSGVTVHAEGGLSPSPVTVVGSDAIHVVRIAADPSAHGCYFLWIVADNLRIAAGNAIQIAESLVFSPAARE